MNIIVGNVNVHSLAINQLLDVLFVIKLVILGSGYQYESN